jgi:hypothetical protein
MDESMTACEIQVPVLPVDGMLATHFVQPRRVQVSLKQVPIQRLPTTPFSLVLRKEFFDCPQSDSHEVHYI